MNRQTEINSETAADWVTKNPTENAELPTSPGVLIAKAPVGNGCLHARLRAGQKAFFEGVNKHRLCAFKARRQYGKTTTLATIALKRMCALPNHTVIFGTARLNLATELVRKQDELVGITKHACGPLTLSLSPSDGERVAAGQVRGIRTHHAFSEFTMLRVADPRFGHIPKATLDAPRPSPLPSLREPKRSASCLASLVFLFLLLACVRALAAAITLKQECRRRSQTRLRFFIFRNA